MDASTRKNGLRIGAAGTALLVVLVILAGPGSYGAVDQSLDKPDSVAGRTKGPDGMQPEPEFHGDIEGCEAEWAFYVLGVTPDLMNRCEGSLSCSTAYPAQCKFRIYFAIEGTGVVSGKLEVAGQSWYCGPSQYGYCSLIADLVEIPVGTSAPIYCWGLPDTVAVDVRLHCGGEELP